MKKANLCLLTAALILTAYSGQSVADNLRDKTDKKCEGDPQAPMVTFNFNSGKSDPECVKARLGTTILFRITPKRKALERVDVTIEPKNSLDTWLHGKNDEIDDVVTLRIPGDYDPKEKPKFSDHYYSVIVGDQKFDPRVEVEH